MLLPLIRALQGGEIFVEAVNTETHEEVRLPKGFWVGEWRLMLRNDYDRRTATLQAQLNRELYGPVYLNPRLIVSQSSTAQPSEEPAQPTLRAYNPTSPEQIIREYVRERERQGLAPNTDAAFKLVREMHPTYGRARTRELYKNITNRDVQYRGRQHGKRRVIRDLTPKKGR